MTSYIVDDILKSSCFEKFGEGGSELRFWRGGGGKGSDGLDSAALPYYATELVG